MKRLTRLSYFLKSGSAALLRKVPLQLAVFAAGLLLASMGAYWVYPPAGLILAGLVLMGISLFGDKSK